MIQSSSRRSLLSALFALAAASLGASACDNKPKPEESRTNDKSGTPNPAGDPSPTPAAGPDKEYKIAWSVWTGWMPFKLPSSR